MIHLYTTPKVLQSERETYVRRAGGQGGAADLNRQQVVVHSFRQAAAHIAHSGNDYCGRKVQSPDSPLYPYDHHHYVDPRRACALWLCHNITWLLGADFLKFMAALCVTDSIRQYSSVNLVILPHRLPGTPFILPPLSLLFLFCLPFSASPAFLFLITLHDYLTPRCFPSLDVTICVFPICA